VVISSNYVFYMSGQLATCSACFYDLAGAVAIATDGTVVAGEQDYNCTCARGSPEPSGDKITGGMLTVSPTTGQGTLTLTTNNAYAGVNGTETFAVQFADTNHALISQFDGSATSSGSMDLQTLTSPPSLGSGSYAFILSGVDSYPGAVAYGGVFTMPSSGTTLQNGVYDANDGLTPNGVTRGTTLSGTFTEPDFFGRGTITSSLLDPASGGQIPLNYYVVGPETIRLISVDDSPGIYGGAVVGSAFGQGTNATAANNASLGSSVFAIAGNPFVAGVAALGQFSTSNTSSSTANFSGIASTDDLVTNSSGASFNAQISGTYSIASNGYGTLTITPGDLPDYMSSMGIYLTDPGLNLMDPSNGLGGGEFSGGALILDVDQNLGLAGVTGVIIPQTNTSTAAFAGNYAVGAQDFNSFNPSSTCPNLGPGSILCEFDLVGQGSVASLVLSGTAQINDPDFTLTTNATDSVGFSGTPVADPNNPGRYTLYPEYDAPNSLELTFDYGVAPRDLDMVIYQANAGLLFWLEVDSNGVWLGPLEQMGSLAGIPAARKGAVKSAMPKQNPPARSR
jgi:hypothetical protein